MTATAAWTARTTDQNNEHRLLQVQTKQASSLISAAVLAIGDPLQGVLDVASATGGDPGQFHRSMSSLAGPQGLFVATSLWRTTATDAVSVATAGSSPALSPTSAAAQAFIRRAGQSSTFVVMSVGAGDTHRIAYALGDPKHPGFVIYAERTIPANRRVPVEADSAFADLHFATYLGPTTQLSALQTTDLPLRRLPLTGDTVRAAIPFGDSVITLVTAPRSHLGGALAGELGWICLVAGVALTVIAALVGGVLVRRRTEAEANTGTITELYERLDNLYEEQRSISRTLQHALLPLSNPAIDGLQSSSRYVAGGPGVDIGGDWYSLIRVDDAHFAFVVGDVSGRGVGAAAIMARIRFTLRAYLLEGHSPEVALAMCSPQLDVEQDGHIATVLVGKGDLTSRRVTLVNAGHPNPLIMAGGRAEFVATTIGPPLGIGATSYQPTTVQMEPDGLLLAFTDGLVERRDTAFDRRLELLADTVSAAPVADSLDELLTSLLTVMTGDEAEDDTAMLAIRWNG